MCSINTVKIFHYFIDLEYEISRVKKGTGPSKSEALGESALSPRLCTTANTVTASSNPFNENLWLIGPLVLQKGHVEVSPLTHLFTQLSQPTTLWQHGETTGLFATDLHTEQSRAWPSSLRNSISFSNLLILCSINFMLEEYVSPSGVSHRRYLDKLLSAMLGAWSTMSSIPVTLSCTALEAASTLRCPPKTNTTCCLITHQWVAFTIQ